MTNDYQPPEWLRTARAVYFDGYAPPVHPRVRDFDARRLVELTREIGGDTLRFQPVGYRALYPSKVFPVFPELGSRDLIDEVSRECRRADLHLYCYCILAGGLDAKVVDDPRYAPFALRAVDGRPPRVTTGYGNGTMVTMCGTGEPYRRMLREQVRELCAHDIDGVYFDAPSGYRGVCFCDSCRVGFREATGMDPERLAGVRDLDDLPADTDMAALSAWYDWANEITRTDLEDLRRIIHDSGKFMLCHNGATWRNGAFHAQYRYSDGFMVEYSEQLYQRLLRGLMGAAMARPARRLAQTYMGSYDVAANGHPIHTRPWAAHILNLEDGDEIRMEGFVNLAGGNMPLYGVANRMLYGIGDGSTDPVNEVFSLARKAELVHRDSLPVAHVSIVPVADCLEMFRSRRRSWNMLMSEGMALVLLDARVSFDVVPNLEMTADWLRSQKVIVLCGASAVTDGDARLLTRWVSEGGSLLATYDTGLYRENGELRRDGGALAEVLGVEMTADAPDGRADTYYRILRDHPAVGGYPTGRMVMGDSMLVRVTPRPGATVLAEAVTLDTDEVLGPAIVANTHGRGRTLYIGGSLEAQYAASRVVSLRRMLAAAVRWLADDVPEPFSLEAPTGVYGVLRRAPSGDLALWVCANVGFKDAAVGRMRQEYLPVPNVVAKVRVPQGRRLQSARLVRADRAVEFSTEGEYAVIPLPPVHIAEVLHLHLA